MSARERPDRSQSVEILVSADPNLAQHVQGILCDWRGVTDTPDPDRHHLPESYVALESYGTGGAERWIVFSDQGVTCSEASDLTMWILAIAYLSWCHAIVSDETTIPTSSEGTDVRDVCDGHRQRVSEGIALHVRLPGGWWREALDLLSSLSSPEEEEDDRTRRSMRSGP